MPPTVIVAAPSEVRHRLVGAVPTFQPSIGREIGGDLDRLVASGRVPEQVGARSHRAQDTDGVGSVVGARVYEEGEGGLRQLRLSPRRSRRR
jgi:hypothetical protein